MVSLLKAGANVNFKTKTGDSSLILAARLGYLGGTKYSLIKWTQTIPCFAGFKEIVEVLIQNRANVNQANAYGNTAIYASASRGNLTQTRSKTNWTDRDFFYKGYSGIVDLLIRNGADVNHANQDGDTPLMMASQDGYYETVDLLLRNGAHCNAGNKLGNTCLILAANSGNYKSLKFDQRIMK